MSEEGAPALPLSPRPQPPPAAAPPSPAVEAYLREMRDAAQERWQREQQQEEEASAPVSDVSAGPVSADREEDLSASLRVAAALSLGGLLSEFSAWDDETAPPAPPLSPLLLSRAESAASGAALPQAPPGPAAAWACAGGGGQRSHNSSGGGGPQGMLLRPAASADSRPPDTDAVERRLRSVREALELAADMQRARLPGPGQSPAGPRRLLQRKPSLSAPASPAGARAARPRFDPAALWVLSRAGSCGEAREEGCGGGADAAAAADNDTGGSPLSADSSFLVRTGYRRQKSGRFTVFSIAGGASDTGSGGGSDFPPAPDTPRGGALTKVTAEPGCGGGESARAGAVSAMVAVTATGEVGVAAAPTAPQAPAACTADGFAGSAGKARGGGAVDRRLSPAAAAARDAGCADGFVSVDLGTPLGKPSASVPLAAVGALSPGVADMRRGSSGAAGRAPAGGGGGARSPNLMCRLQARRMPLALAPLHAFLSAQSHVPPPASH